MVWVNDDSRSHNVTADDGTFDSGAIAPGDSFSFTFNEEGTWLFTDPSSASPLWSGSIQVGPETSQSPVSNTQLRAHET